MLNTNPPDQNLPRMRQSFFELTMSKGYILMARSIRLHRRGNRLSTLGRQEINGIFLQALVTRYKKTYNNEHGLLDKVVGDRSLPNTQAGVREIMPGLFLRGVSQVGGQYN